MPAWWAAVIGNGSYKSPVSFYQLCSCMSHSFPKEMHSFPHLILLVPPWSHTLTLGHVHFVKKYIQLKILHWYSWDDCGSMPLAKQGDNRIGSICLSVCLLYVCPSVCYNSPRWTVWSTTTEATEAHLFLKTMVCFQKVQFLCFWASWTSKADPRLPFVK